MKSIIDLYGRAIEITDLEKAIQQAEWFKDAQHIPPVESDKERQQYWSDVYVKLLQLKAKQNEQSGR